MSTPFNKIIQGSVFYNNITDAKNDRLDGEGIIIAADKLYNGGSTKLFAHSQNWKHFWKHYVKALGKRDENECYDDPNHHLMGFYEIIENDKPCHLYADFDWEHSEINVNDDFVKDKFVGFFREALRRTDPKCLKKFEKGHQFTNAGRDGKGSIHYVNSAIYFKTQESLKKYIQVVADLIDSDPSVWFMTQQKDGKWVAKTPFDRGVYSNDRQMRLVMSYKAKDGEMVRPLIPSDWNIFDESPETYVITWINKDAKLVDVGSLNFITDITFRHERTLSEDLIKEIVSRQPGITLKSLTKGSSSSKSRTSKTKTYTTNYVKPNEICELCGENVGFCHPYIVVNEESGIISMRCHDSKRNGKQKILYAAPKTTKTCTYRDVFAKLTIDNRRHFPDGEDVDKIKFASWLKNAVKYINEYVVKIEGKKVCIAMFTNVMSFDDGRESEFGWNIVPINEFYLGAEQYRIQTDTGKYESLAKVWSRNFDCSTKSILVNHVVDSHDSSIHNMFNGLKIDELASLAGDYDKGSELADFIKRVWCNNDEDVYDYVISWMAHLIQRPGKQIKTAICVRGEEGTGKSSIITKLCEIIGWQYSLQESNIQNVFGTFNACLQGKFLVYLNEAFFYGARDIGERLKNAVTEPTLQLNIKNVSQFTMRNNANFIIDTNNQRIISAGRESRRWCVLETTNEALGYSDEQREEIFGTKAVDFAKFLYSINIDDWDPTKIPETQALKEQRDMSWSPVESFVYKIYESDGFEWKNSDMNYSASCGEPVPSTELYEEYKKSDKFVSQKAFALAISKMEVDGKSLFEKTQNRVVFGGKRVVAYKLPTLDLLKKYFKINNDDHTECNAAEESFIDDSAFESCDSHDD